MNDLMKLTKKQLIEIIEKKDTPAKASLKAHKGDTDASLAIREALTSIYEQIKAEELKTARVDFGRFTNTSSDTVRRLRERFRLGGKEENLEIALQHLSLLIEREFGVIISRIK